MRNHERRGLVVSARFAFRKHVRKADVEVRELASKELAIHHAGQARKEARTTASSSARVAPSTACTDNPCRTVE